jgi:hypothetical protein
MASLKLTRGRLAHGHRDSAGIRPGITGTANRVPRCRGALSEGSDRDRIEQLQGYLGVVDFQKTRSARFPWRKPGYWRIKEMEVRGLQPGS